MPSNFLKSLSQTKKYIIYTSLSLGSALLIIQGIKYHQKTNHSLFQFSNTHKASQRKALQKQKENFSVTKYTDEAFAQYLQAAHASSTEDYKYAYFSHYHFMDFITEVTDLMNSMRAHHPILDKDTYSNLYLFRGPEGNEKGSYCNLFAKKVNLLTALGKYHFFLMTAAANNDPERIKRYQKIQEHMSQDRKRLYEYKNIFRELVNKNCESHLMDYFLRDKYPTRAMSLVKHTIRAESLIPPAFLAMSEYVGFNMKKELEESKIGAWGLKMIHLHLLDLEYLFKIDRLGNDLRRSRHTWASFFNKYFIRPLGFTPWNESLAHSFPYFSQGTIAWMLNHIWRICWKPFGGSTAPLIPNSRGRSLVDTFYSMLTSPLFILKYMVKEPLDIINNTIYQSYKSTFAKGNRYEIYAEAINEGLSLVKQVQRLNKLMKKLDKTIKTDKALEELCQPYLKPIRHFLYSPSLRKLRYIIREIKKIRIQPVTSWQLRWSFLSFFDTTITDILRLVKRLDELPEEEEKALMTGLTAFCMLETFVSTATFAHETATKKSAHGFVPAEIIEPTEETKKVSTPDIHLKGIYTLFIPIQSVVKNNFHNLRNQAGKELTTAIQGLNGAGKSIFLQEVLLAIVSAQSVGYVFGDKAAINLIDYLRFYANIKDNASKNLSLMMSEAEKLDELLTLSDIMTDKEKAIFVLDEPGKGTTTEESGPLILSTIAYLQQKGNNVTLLSTHINTLFYIAERLGYQKLSPFTPGFDPKKGFTYTINPGMGQDPVCIHVLEKMDFHPSVLENTVKILASDPNYRFRNKLQSKTSNTTLSSFFAGDIGRIVERLLFLLLILMIGMLLGTFLPTVRQKGVTGNSGQAEDDESADLTYP